MSNGDFNTFTIRNAIISATDFLAYLINKRTFQLGDLVYAWNSAILNDISTGNSTLAGIINSRADQQTSNTQKVLDAVNNIAGVSESTILAGIESGTNQVIVSGVNSSNNVVTVLDNSISNQTTILDQVINGAIAPLSDVLDLILGQVSGQQAVPDINIDNNIDVLNDIINEISFAPIIEIENTTVIDSGLFDSIIETVGDIFTNQQGELDISLGNIVDGLTDLLADMSRSLLDPDDTLVKPLMDIVSAILHNKDINTGVLTEVLNENDDGIGAVIVRGVTKAFKKQLRISADELRKSAGDIVDPQGTESLDITCLMDDTLTAQDGAGRDDEIYEYIASFLSLLAFPMTLSSAKSAACLAVWSEDHPWKTLDIGDAARMKHLGILNQTEAQRIIQRNGYGQGDALNLLNSAQELPTVGEMLTLWLRNVLDDAGIDVALSQHGINPSYIEGLKEIAFFIPPVQDLVTMAVREVFNVPLATAQGQFEDFPEEFAESAKQQGVSEVWAKRYWAAHWVLPSIQMGFEMLQRDVITKAELQDLMKVLDIMPGWRDKLIQISYSPFTRVDIRRMHKTGTLNESGVLRAYKDIGYDSEKAQTLTDFTIKLNEDEGMITLDIASDLTRSNIVGFYVDGIIKRVPAFLLLVQAGINVAAAELFLQDADFRIEKKERKQQVNIIIDRFKAGGSTFLEADDRLRGLGLQVEELALAQLDLARVREQLTAIPSRSDLDKFLKAGIIDEPQYLNGMELLGFSSVWSGRYLEIAKG
ncbi:hypothetical protein LCGC14_0949200 [marine sediment metagenome]|uniref:Uncharacterized protein n=1 Tax=marine sediment metagenome TaxID=412755 RepID=A0A0F9P3X1_9ZZZZ